MMLQFELENRKSTIRAIEEAYVESERSRKVRMWLLRALNFPFCTPRSPRPLSQNAEDICRSLKQTTRDLTNKLELATQRWNAERRLVSQLHLQNAYLESALSAQKHDLMHTAYPICTVADVATNTVVIAADATDSVHQERHFFKEPTLALDSLDPIPNDNTAHPTNNNTSTAAVVGRSKTHEGDEVENEDPATGATATPTVAGAGMGEHTSSFDDIQSVKSQPISEASFSLPRLTGTSMSSSSLTTTASTQVDDDDVSSAVVCGKPMTMDDTIQQQSSQQQQRTGTKGGQGSTKTYGSDPVFREIRQAYNAVLATAREQENAVDRWLRVVMSSSTSSVIVTDPVQVESVVTGLQRLCEDQGLSVPLVKVGSCQYRLGRRVALLRLIHGKLVVKSGPAWVEFMQWLEKQPLYSSSSTTTTTEDIL